jgi:hypothetical protein
MYIESNAAVTYSNLLINLLGFLSGNVHLYHDTIRLAHHHTMHNAMQSLTEPSRHPYIRNVIGIVQPSSKILDS